MQLWCLDRLDSDVCIYIYDYAAVHNIYIYMYMHQSVQNLTFHKCIQCGSILLKVHIILYAPCIRIKSDIKTACDHVKSGVSRKIILTIITNCAQKTLSSQKGLVIYDIIAHHYKVQNSHKMYIKKVEEWQFITQ